MKYFFFCQKLFTFLSWWSLWGKKFVGDLLSQKKRNKIKLASKNSLQLKPQQKKKWKSEKVEKKLKRNNFREKLFPSAGKYAKWERRENFHCLKIFHLYFSIHEVISRYCAGKFPSISVSISFPQPSHPHPYPCEHLRMCACVKCKATHNKKKRIKKKWKARAEREKEKSLFLCRLEH